MSPIETINADTMAQVVEQSTQPDNGSPGQPDDTTMTKNDNVNTVTETMARLKQSRSTINRLIREGELKPVRIGSRVLFLDSEIDRFLRSKQRH